MTSSNEHFLDLTEEELEGCWYPGRGALGEGFEDKFSEEAYRQLLLRKFYETFFEGRKPIIPGGMLTSYYTIPEDLVDRLRKEAHVG